MSITTLKEMMGIEPDNTVNYPLPQLNRDALDSVENIRQYTAAKMVLEHPEVNPILEKMNAFDTLNKFSVSPSVEMAQWVVEALGSFYGETSVESFYHEFPFIIENEELNEFAQEFLVEFSNNRLNSVPDVSANMPDVEQGWLDKLAAKFGFHDVGFKELVLLYMMNQAKQGMQKKPDEAMPMPEPVGEGVIDTINEQTLPGIDSWVNEVKSQYMTLCGSNWGEALYASAWGAYDSIKPIIQEADDASLKSEKDDGRAAPKPSAKVKADVKQRLKELTKLINDHKSEAHFYGDVKPAVYNAKESLETIMNFLKAGTMNDYKQAQIHFQKLMSPITNLFPPTLVKFLAHGSDGVESAVLKPAAK